MSRQANFTASAYSIDMSKYSLKTRFVLLNDQNDDAFGLKDLRVGLTSQRLRQKKKKKCFSLPPTISNLGTLKSHLKAILVPNDSSKPGNFHASVLLGFA